MIVSNFVRNRREETRRVRTAARGMHAQSRIPPSCDSDVFKVEPLPRRHPAGELAGGVHPAATAMVRSGKLKLRRGLEDAYGEGTHTRSGGTWCAMYTESLGTYATLIPRMHFRNTPTSGSFKTVEIFLTKKKSPRRMRKDFRYKCAVPTSKSFLVRTVVPRERRLGAQEVG